LPIEKLIPINERPRKRADFQTPIAAVRRNFAGPVVIGRDLMEV
jgi:hypothetical protein